MPSKINQDHQVQPSQTYDDTLPSGATLESGATSVEDDLNGLRSQVNKIIGQTNWYDAPNNTLEDIGAGGTDELIKVSANDTTAGYLGAKTVGAGVVVLQELNDGGDEDLQIGAFYTRDVFVVTDASVVEYVLTYEPILVTETASINGLVLVEGTGEDYVLYADGVVQILGGDLVVGDVLRVGYFHLGVTSNPTFGGILYLDYAREEFDNRINQLTAGYRLGAGYGGVLGVDWFAQPGHAWHAPRHSTDARYWTYQPSAFTYAEGIVARGGGKAFADLQPEFVPDLDFHPMRLTDTGVREAYGETIATREARSSYPCIAVGDNYVFGCSGSQSGDGHTWDIAAWDRAFVDAEAPAWRLNTLDAAAMTAVHRVWASGTRVAFTVENGNRLIMMTEDGDDGDGGGLGSYLWSWTAPTGWTIGNTNNPCGGAFSLDGSIFFVAVSGDSGNDARIWAFNTETGAEVWDSGEVGANSTTLTNIGVVPRYVAGLSVDVYGDLYGYFHDQGTWLTVQKFSADGTFQWDLLDHGLDPYALFQDTLSATPIMSAALLDVDELGGFFITRGAESGSARGEYLRIRSRKGLPDPWQRAVGSVHDSLAAQANTQLFLEAQSDPGVLDDLAGNLPITPVTNWYLSAPPVPVNLWPGTLGSSWPMIGTAQSTVTVAAIQIVGSLVLRMKMHVGVRPVADARIVLCGLFGATEATNVLWELRWLDTTTIRYFHESGAGVGHTADFTITAVTPGEVLYLNLRRTDNGDSTCDVEIWAQVNDGSLVQLVLSATSGTDNMDDSATLTSPTGGTSSTLQLFQFDGGSFWNRVRLECLQVLSAAPSDVTEAAAAAALMPT